MSQSPTQQLPLPTTQNYETRLPDKIKIDLPKLVQLYQGTAYRTFKSLPQDQGVEFVHFADFEHPEVGRIDAYAKIYRSNSGFSRGLLNEITAYVLARALGASVAQHAFVCLIPLSKVKTELPPWLKKLLKEDKEASYPAFCTSEILGPSAKFYSANIGSKIFAEELRSWDELMLATRLDQHITNTDRHLGNLIRTKKNTFCLFDHGRLVTEYGDWDTNDLTSQCFKKYPDSLLKRAWPNSCPSSLISEMLMHTAFHSTALSIALPELRSWWNLLVEPESSMAFEQYLVTRAKELSGMYEREYNLLPL